VGQQAEILKDFKQKGKADQSIDSAWPKPHVFSHIWNIDLIQRQRYYETLVTQRGGHI
jgi:hypothetical protein